MLAENEQDEIYYGIDEILYYLNILPIEDVAYFINKEDSNVAKKLFNELAKYIGE